MGWMGSLKTYRQQPIMDYSDIRDNLRACGMQEQELCEKCKYYLSEDCRSRLIFEAEIAMSNLIEERSKYNGRSTVDQAEGGDV